MPELNKLTIFYTYHLEGDMDFLPRLYTFLERVRQGRGVSLLLDLGENCSPKQWHCEATAGRSTLIVLDGMGYHCANVQGALSASERIKLDDVVIMGMVDQRHVWRFHVPPIQDEGIIVSSTPTPALKLNIVLAPHPSTQLEGNILHLQALEKGQVGVVTLSITPLKIQQTEILSVPDNEPPAPSIIGAVEFVLEEAEFFKKKKG
jgi:hypothetical protein